MKLYLVEERFLSRHRMLANRSTNLPDAKCLAAVSPFCLHVGFLAFRLYRRLVFGAKETLPGNINTGREIADVRDALFFEHLADLRVQLLVNHAQIDNRRRAAFLGDGHTEKVDLPRPAMQVRTLGVVKDRLVVRVWCRGVNLASDAFARQVAVFRIEFMADGAGHAFEIFGTLQVKPAVQKSAMLIEFLLQLLSVGANPIRQIDMVSCGFENEWQTLALAQRTLLHWAELRKVDWSSTNRPQIFLNRGFHKLLFHFLQQPAGSMRESLQIHAIV